jgi:hypothetical protein
MSCVFPLHQRKCALFGSTSSIDQQSTSGKSVCLEYEGVHLCFQAWMTTQPPPRGNYFFSRPRVHRGFQATFASNGLDARLVEFLGGLLTDHDMVSANVDVLVTGVGIDRDSIRFWPLS